MIGASIEIKRSWDGKLMQTVDLLPEGSAAVLIGYTLDPWPEEGGLASAVAAALAQGLTEYGVVAGRWMEDVRVPADAHLWPAAPQNPLERIVGRMRHSWAAPVVTTRSAGVVLELLGQGWEMQDQALLVMALDGNADQAEAVKALSVNRDWREFGFPEPVRALIAPGVDGDFILVAAATEAWLDDVLETVTGSFAAAGFEILDAQRA